MKKQKVVILSAQFPGFMNLVEGLSSEDISKLMNSINDLVESSFKIHGGKINQYSGEKLLVVFENPGSKPSVPAHAVDAIIELKDRIVSFRDDETINASLKLNTGIATGEVIIGELGSQQTLMGKAVTHANRICEFAREGQVLVDSHIHEATQKLFEFQSLEPIPIKGTDETLPIFELTGKKRRKLNLKVKSERKIVSEMVGRDKEFELINKRIQGLVVGEGSVINIVGKAGIGKSRLMEELKVQPVLEKVALMEGRALSSGENLSFHPITHILKSWAEITEEDSSSQAYEKLHQSIVRVAPDKKDEIFPFLAKMMGFSLKDKAAERVAGIEGESLEKLILKNLRDLLTKAAGIRPIIIVLEDLHWADASSISFLKSLYKLVQKHQILFINILRPGYEKTGDQVIKYIEENLSQYYSYVLIGSLAENESEDLMKNLLNKVPLPAEVRDMIIRKSEGNPFFIEEIIRSFIDEEIIEVKNNEFLVTEKIEHANIPETINDVILSRVDKLDEKTKELLKTASVIGRNFYFKVLEEAADTIGELDDRLNYLKEVQLISESKKKEEIEYLFKHALAQQATYDSILKESRKEIHLKIARSIENVFAENLHEFYGTLAQHYEVAEDKEKSENYLFMAGKESLNSGSPSEALRFFKMGLELYQTISKKEGHDQKLADYNYNLGISCYSGGYNIETIKYIDKFENLHKTGLPHNKILLIFGIIKKLIKLILAVNFSQFFFKREPTPLDDIFVKMYVIKAQSMVTIDPKRFFFETIFFTSKLINWNLKKTQLGEGVFAETSAIFIWTGISFSLGRKMLEIFENPITREKEISLMKIRHPKIMLRLFSGHFTPDQDEEEVFNTGLKVGTFWETTSYLIFSTYIHIETGNLNQAQKISNRILEVADSFENIHSKSQYYRVTSVVMMKFRKLDEVLEITKKGIDFTCKTGHLAVTLIIQSCRIIALCLTNKLSEAAEILDKARPVAIERKRGVIFYSTYLIARCHYEIASAKMTLSNDKLRKEEKKKLIRTSTELIKYSKKYSGNLIEAYRLSGLIHQMTGNHKKAISFFDKSIEFAIASSGDLELSRTYFDLGKFLSDPQTKQNQLNGLSGNDYLEKAKALFEKMDLQWDLEEYRKYKEEL